MSRVCREGTPGDSKSEDREGTSESLLLDQSYPLGEKDELSPRVLGKAFHARWSLVWV